MISSSFRRLVLLRQLVVGTAAVLDGEVEDRQEDADRDRAAEDDQEDVELVDVAARTVDA